MTRDPPKHSSTSDDALGDEAIDRLVHLRSGRATRADRRSFLAWRRQSPAHEAAAREAEALWRDLGETGAAAKYGGAAGEPTGAAATRLPARHSRRRVLAGGLAASVTVVAAVGSGAFGPVSGVLADHATRPGERRDVRLPDGSVASLNTSSALSVDYSDRARRLTLHTGEALFDVRKNNARPFLVAAGGGNIRALGTVFSVLHENAGVRVVVGEGAVRIALDADPAASADVAAGQQLTFGSSRGISPPRNADVATATAWMRGKLVFNARPLAEVVAELERYRAGRIVVASPDLETLKVSGVFDLGDTERILDTFERTLRIDVVRLPLMTVIR